MLVPVPVTDEQARAVAAVAQTGQSIVEEGGQLARYIGRILGTAPEDAVGLTLGDPLHALRTLSAAKLDALVNKILKRRGVEQPTAVSPSIAIPILNAAYDETRSELQDVWARLIAAAMDPNRTSRVRSSYVQIIKKLDPLDAKVMLQISSYDGREGDTIAVISHNNNISRDEADVCLNSLTSLGLLSNLPSQPYAYRITALGRELMRAIKD